MRLTPLRTLGVALLGALLVVGAACADSSDADDASTPDPLSTVIATVEDSRNPAGGGIEPANPISPPEGTLASTSGEVDLGLGSYCWSPPASTGAPSICADAIGIITSTSDLTVEAGETLRIADETPGTLPWPPMAIRSASLWVASDEPTQAAAEYRAWQPAGGFEGGIDLEVDSSEIGAHTITLPASLEPGRYLLSVFYTAGPDRGSDASYGAILIVE